MTERISDLSQFGSKLFKCARCDKWWAKSKAELLEELGDVPIQQAAALLAKDCKHAGTFSGCGAYWATKDIHVDEAPPGHLRYRWLSQLERVGATLNVQCDRCGRGRTVAPPEMKRIRQAHGQDGDLSMDMLSRRLRCKCGARAATLEWVAPASGLPPLGDRRKRDRDARGSWRLEDGSGDR